MEIGSLQSTGSGGSVSSANVKLQNSAADQQEAVVGKIMEGVEQAPAPRADGQTGQSLNTVA